jgi:microcystin-dependent protein
MADPTTPHYNYTLPTVGLDRDAWGDLINNNWTKLDADLWTATSSGGSLQTQINAIKSALANTIEPVGTIRPWPMAAAPLYWVACDGGALSRTGFADLFALLGTTYGGGDGSTTFNVPNYVGRVLVHRDNGTIFVGTLHGENSHVLQVSELPSHSHTGATDTQGVHNHTEDPGLLGGAAAGFQQFISNPTQTGGTPLTTSTGGGHAHNLSIAAAGGGAAHNNMQAGVGVQWMIKATKTVIP